MERRNVQCRISSQSATVSLYTTGNVLHARHPFMRCCLVGLQYKCYFNTTEGRLPSSAGQFTDVNTKYGAVSWFLGCSVTVGPPCIYIILTRILISLRTYLGFQHDIALNPRGFLISWDWTSEYENCAFVYFQRVSPFLLYWSISQSAAQNDRT
jgi:hypothetical protein